MSMHVDPKNLNGAPFTGFKLLKPAESTTAHLKMALMGFQGSGKTYTATSVAIGLVELMREMRLPDGNKPVAFLDSGEKGVDWVTPRFEKAGIHLFTHKSRAFTDLLTIAQEAEAGASVLIVDSLTHFWQELCETYCRRKAEEYRRSTYRLQFQDWAYLKGQWRRFTDLFVNGAVHTILAGRAGYEYDMVPDEETEKKQLEKTGIKLKAEGEMGYEPDLLVLMERRMNIQTKKDEHIAHVLKDRSTLLDGEEMTEPTFNFFLPHIKCLKLGGRQMGVDLTRTSEAIVPTDARDNRATQRAIMLDNIESLLVKHFPSTGAADKKRKIELLQSHFNANWAEIEKVMPLFDLRAGYESLHQELEGKPSKYVNTPITEKVPLTVDIKDGIPEFLKRDLPPTNADPNWITEFTEA